MTRPPDARKPDVVSRSVCLVTRDTSPEKTYPTAMPARMKVSLEERFTWAMPYARNIARDAVRKALPTTR